jgi:hypothetical protein
MKRLLSQTNFYVIFPIVTFLGYPIQQHSGVGILATVQISTHPTVQYSTVSPFPPNNRILVLGFPRKSFFYFRRNRNSDKITV